MERMTGILTLSKPILIKDGTSSSADLEFRSNVAVLGSEVAKTFFGQLDPVGEDINIDVSCSM